MYEHIWPDPIADQVFDYIIELEPELEGSSLIIVATLALIAGIMAVVSYVGPLLFKSWARHVYLAVFVVVFALYPFMGVTVYSGVGQIFYDLSMVLSGVVLALAYYSPVAEYYEGKI